MGRTCEHDRRRIVEVRALLVGVYQNAKEGGRLLDVVC